MAFNFTYNYPQVARESGFKLRNYKDGPLDWHLIGSMEVERILRDQSLEQIDAVVNHLSEAPLGSLLDSNILDSGIAKYFILSQFSVQYLIFCRKFLEETVTDLRESHGVSQMELATLKRSLTEANNEILQLHKKITQIEAIHEVIYPCHLCTKNFVSNDALNLHISRKHSGVIAQQETKSKSAAQSQLKERENDLTLINTIKLELEIKQLKERLNNAEREIKDKTIEFHSKNVPQQATAAFEKSEQISVHSIGIQSNLSEIKESDDLNSEDDKSTSSQGRQHLCMLEQRLQEFEKWKEEQKLHNSEFLTEINIKLQDLTLALELIKNRKEQEIDNDKQNSASVDNLEVLLCKKIEDIHKSNAAKLEEVLSKMELNYKNKLDQLERELFKQNRRSILQKQNKSPNKKLIQMEDLLTQSVTENSIKETYKISKIPEQVSDNINPNSIDYNSESDQPKSKQPHKELSSASESNHTFVKYNSTKQSEKDNCIHTNSDDHNESISSSLSEDDSTDVSGSLLDEENIQKYNSQLTQIDSKHTVDIKGKKPGPKKQLAQKITRKDAKKLTNQRLLALGVEMKTKLLPTSMKKRLSAELNEQRNKLKQKHSHFHITRNKIKKFVDKLCSTKMPESAEALLKVTTPFRPKNQEQEHCFNEYSSTDEEKEESKYVTASKALDANSLTIDTQNFKQRLERVLASPIRKPDEHFIKAIVHQKPIPLPRKRVMFNNPEMQESRLERSLSLSNSDESQSLDRYQAQNINKTSAKSSLGHFI